MLRPEKVAARNGCRIWIRYSDGTEGEVGLSDLAGRGVFETRKDRAFFEVVRISPYGSLTWGEEIELCPDAVYVRLTGRAAEDLFPGLRTTNMNARDLSLLRHYIIRMFFDDHLPPPMRSMMNARRS
jgi:hypothetical protein